MPNLADAVAVATIRAADLPVLFIDTCSIIDPIRAPLRPDALKGCIEAAQELLHLVTTSPARCTLVVASLIRDEWLKNAGPEGDKLRDHLVRVDNESERLHHFCKLIQATPPFASSNYRSLPLVDRLHSLSRQLLDSALCLEEDQRCVIKAYYRATTAKPPSRKGGEVKDSTIVEEYLEVSRQLQSVGFSRNRVFCSSNTKDYCDQKRLHEELAIDFAEVGLGFAWELPWALHEIKKA